MSLERLTGKFVVRKVYNTFVVREAYTQVCR